jgi:ring-1,2-phenylacetyl-CoA epoxidase subunit PaaD
VVSLGELGVLRGVQVLGPGRVRVELTPTWTGCPALDAMAADITEVLTSRGMAEVVVDTVLSPAWSTDAVTPDGAGPDRAGSAGPGRGGPVAVDLAIRCPHCGGADTRLLSRFSSTACKALRRCESCGEPFDYFKEV